MLIKVKLSKEHACKNCNAAVRPQDDELCDECAELLENGG